VAYPLSRIGGDAAAAAAFLLDLHDGAGAADEVTDRTCYYCDAYGVDLDPHLRIAEVG